LRRQTESDEHHDERIALDLSFDGVNRGGGAAWRSVHRLAAELLSLIQNLVADADGAFGDAADALLQARLMVAAISHA
jgi:hypothetical protein